MWCVLRWCCFLGLHVSELGALCGVAALLFVWMRRTLRYSTGRLPFAGGALLVRVLLAGAVLPSADGLMGKCVLRVCTLARVCVY